MEASKNTDTPLDENLVNQIMEMAQTSPDQLMAAISQDEALSNTITGIYNAKKQSSPMMKDGGKIAYLNCLKSGGAIADCGCKKVSKAEKGKVVKKDNGKYNGYEVDRKQVTSADGTTKTTYALRKDGFSNHYYEKKEDAPMWRRIVGAVNIAPKEMVNAKYGLKRK